MGSKVTDASDNVTAGADGTKSLIVYFQGWVKYQGNRMQFHQRR